MSQEQTNVVKTSKNKLQTVFDQESLQRTRDFLSMYPHEHCPNEILNRLDEQLKKQPEHERYYLKIETKGLIDRALPIVGLETHHLLAGAVYEEFRLFAIEFSRQLIAEYGCQTAAEKALAETVVAAFIRILQSTEVMTQTKRAEHCSPALNGFYQVISKELDRANRHFLTALSTLQQIKSPIMKVTVKAENAFVAQNQQVNTKAPDNDQPKQADYEINDPK